MNAGRLPLRRIAGVFGRYANLTFGGGDATTATLHREIVDKRGWVDERRFGLCFALARLTPGTNMLAFCTGMGWVMRGIAGAVVALLAASVPCSILAIIITIFFDRWSHGAISTHAIGGAMAAAVGITAVACWTIVRPHVGRRSWLLPLLLVVGGFLLNGVLSVAPLTVLLLAAAAGFLLPAEKT